MTYYKNHKNKTVSILSSVAKHIEKGKFDYDQVDLKKALKEASDHYKNYLDMKKDERYKPAFERKTYK
tara:strand:+ start:1090 stop:1293 length:204 start_codon:yes stop_codon:yes gene_type:complete